VWVNLGHSYGWWPAQVQDQTKRVKNVPALVGKPAETVEKEEGSRLFIKFFDDDNLEWVEIKEAKFVQNYSGKNKKRLIKAGFKKFEENKKGSLGGNNLRLAQFYKDVEMAEVMTDNDADVANLLSFYEVAEAEDEEIVPCDSAAIIEEPVANDTIGVSGTSKPKAPSAASKKNKRKPNVMKDTRNGGVKKCRTTKTNSKKSSKS